jgi:uncharacterized membrane protein
MRTPASVAGYSIHPIRPIHLMLPPILAFVASFAFDLAGLVFGTPSPSLWNDLAYYTMICGIIGALVATGRGFIEILSLPGTIKATALMHMAIDVTVVAIYVVNALMRRGTPTDLALPMVLSLIAIVMLLFSDWLGGTDFEGGNVGASD